MTTTYTLEQVKTHNTPADLWLVIQGKVYNITKFYSEHPGGGEVLLESTDATAAFEDVGHSMDARNLLNGFYIGDLEASPEPVPEPRVESPKTTADHTDHKEVPYSNPNSNFAQHTDNSQPVNTNTNTNTTPTAPVKVSYSSSSGSYFPFTSVLIAGAVLGVGIFVFRYLRK
eukprot:TRINITY_DN5508_c0_g1_i1.p1 TRINITY_DN5508_c0_g1~~TRINITY_DN5508_c0_g1_i1.p1  ORF type:complete len:172 (-),score=40.48 TRINITY_DN5508_c0_g1_i1:251-766(-)